MKVELHLHTMRYSGCAQCTPAEMMAELTRLGYGAVFITEHDSVWSDWELENLRRDFPAIRIFPGVELSLSNGDHLLVLGTNDREYITLREPALVLERARQARDLTVLAHPYRWDKAQPLLETGVLPDAVEFRTKNADAKAGAKAKEHADRLGLPMVNAGDTHSIRTLNEFWIETQEDLAAGKDIYDIVTNRRYTNMIAERDD